MKYDATKIGYHRTRDGRVAYVGAYFQKAHYQIVGWVLYEGGSWHNWGWFDYGRVFVNGKHNTDLVEYLGPEMLNATRKIKLPKRTKE